MTKEWGKSNTDLSHHLFSLLHEAWEPQQQWFISNDLRKAREAVDQMPVEFLIAAYCHYVFVDPDLHDTTLNIINGGCITLESCVVYFCLLFSFLLLSHEFCLMKKNKKQKNTHYVCSNLHSVYPLPHLQSVDGMHHILASIPLLEYAWESAHSQTFKPTPAVHTQTAMQPSHKVNKPMNFNSTIMVTQLLIIQESESAQLANEGFLT